MGEPISEEQLTLDLFVFAVEEYLRHGELWLRMFESLVPRGVVPPEDD